MSEVKHYLRRFALNFPLVTSEALQQLQKIIYDRNSQPLIKEISEEFVFFETDRRGNKRPKLSPVKELQVLERICNYFTGAGSDQKTALFLCLFPPGTKLLEERLCIMTKLVSMAISVSNGNVLTCVGVLMQHVGCSGEISSSIAKTIIKDYFEMIPSSSKDTLKNLSSVSPLFCASLITALTHLYASPSPNILEIILEWIIASPTVCFIPLTLIATYNYRPQTPLPGLLQWCILDPVSGNASLPSSNGKTNGTKLTTENIFSSLHLAVLQSMVKISQMKSNLPIHEVMPTPCIINILTKLREKVKDSTVPPQHTEISLDRLAQGLQLALSTHCLQTSQIKINQLFEKINEMPYNRLLFIVMRKWGVLLKEPSAAM